MELIGLTALYITLFVIKEYFTRQDRERLLDQIDSLENKVIEASMAKDLTDYAVNHNRTTNSPEDNQPVVTEPEFISEADLSEEEFLKLMEQRKEKTN